MKFNWTNKVVLIAEDEQANYLFLEKIIEPTDAKILRAGSGTEAIAMVKNNPDINVILMDIGMPEMDGFDASNAIKVLRPDIPIIIQTCNFDIDPEDNKNSNFDAFIRKPINVTRLLAIVDKYITFAHTGATA